MIIILDFSTNLSIHRPTPYITLPCYLECQILFGICFYFCFQFMQSNVIVCLLDLKKNYLQEIQKEEDNSNFCFPRKGLDDPLTGTRNEHYTDSGPIPAGYLYHAIGNKRLLNREMCVGRPLHWLDPDRSYAGAAAPSQKPRPRCKSVRRCCSICCFVRVCWSVTKCYWRKGPQTNPSQSSTSMDFNLYDYDALLDASFP